VDPDFAIGIAMISVLAVAVIVLNKWRPKAGWWLIAVVIGFLIVGNLIEKVATGTSSMF
jgi:cation transport ATPase